MFIVLSRACCGPHCLILFKLHAIICKEVLSLVNALWFLLRKSPLKGKGVIREGAPFFFTNTLAKTTKLDSLKAVVTRTNLVSLKAIVTSLRCLKYLT